MKLNLLPSPSNFVVTSVSRAIAVSIIATQIMQTQIVKAQTVSPETVNPQTTKTQPTLQSVPTIDWNDRLSRFEQSELNQDQVYSFNCLAAPDEQIHTPVWGTNLYTINSGLCQAAVHQGMITTDGGLINIQLLSTNADYQGSDRFGISSLDYSRSSAGFKFIGTPVAFESDLPAESKDEQNQQRRPSQIERTVGNGVRRGIERTISDSIRDIFR